MNKMLTYGTNIRKNKEDDVLNNSSEDMKLPHISLLK